MEWTEERKQSVKDLWFEGYSATDIAHKVHAPSRNSVLGILHRMGLTGLRHGRRGVLSHAYYRKAEPKRQRRKQIQYGKPIERSLRKSPIPMPHEEDIARVAFADLEHHHCRFICAEEPKGMVISGAKMFCGLPKVPGTSYCEGHLARTQPTAKLPKTKVTKAAATEQTEPIPA